jgi:F0F1-type ATP synthase assembly protein I
MSKTQQPTIDPAPQPSRSAVILMLKTFADTTWRMFVPPFGGLGIGFWADTQYHTGPWGMLAGVILGCWTTLWLIVIQIKRIRKK